MLPDLRVVTIAVISTFLFAVSVGFYTSSRLANERKPRPESLAAIEESPLNRIALNWPEPVQQPPTPLDLDFAVTAKVLRNPVRDVTDEQAAEPKVAAAPVSNSGVVLEHPALDLPKIEVLKVESPTIEIPKIEAPKPEVAQIETPRIETVTAPPAPPVTVAPQAKPDDEIPTASVVEAPRVNLNPPGEEPKRAPEPAAQPPATQLANRPDPDSPEAIPDTGIETTPEIKPAPKPAAKKAARKKAKKVAKVAPRPRPIVVAPPTAASFFPFFGMQPN